MIMKSIVFWEEQRNFLFKWKYIKFVIKYDFSHNFVFLDINI